MSKEFKPSGYNSVSPYFIVKGAEKWIALLIKVFSALELRRFSNDDKSIMHVEVQIDDSVIMLSEATDKYPANEFLIHVYVPDVHATFKKAIDAGCEAVQQPERKGGDSDTRGMFKDFAGNMWAVASQSD
jgi:uncharacterized glyoxalase superfamily protein PhnB